jgi:F-type H+-transporting ATPase subunit b
VPIAVIHAGANHVAVVLPGQNTTTTTTSTSTKEPPNPILPVPKEMAWGFGSFLVLFIAMRLWLFPKLNNGTIARNAKAKADREDADRIRREAAEDVARYDAALADARGEAARLIDHARQEVEADRTTKIAAANARIAQRRAAAPADKDAARQAALGQVEDIVVEVASTAAERILQKPVNREAVKPTVSQIVRAGVPA